MSSLKFTDCKVYAAGYDMSGQLNQASLDSACEVLDETTFGQPTRINKGGLLTVNAAVAGLWDSSSATAPDPVIQAQVGTSDLPVIMAPQGAVVGNIAFMFRALRMNYQQQGQVGELFKFSTQLVGSGGHPLVRGKLFQAGSATGNVVGTAIQLGAVGAAQYVYAALEVMSGTGSFIVKVQSDDNSGFTSATDRITFGTVATGTAIASEWARLAGAITDDWWRIVVTNPNTRNFAVAVGIL
jgi:hypothetical protein